MYDLTEFEDPGRTSITHPVACVRYRDEWRYDGMDVAFAQVALDRYCRDETDLFPFPRIVEQSQFVVSI